MRRRFIFRIILLMLTIASLVVWALYRVQRDRHYAETQKAVARMAFDGLLQEEIGRRNEYLISCGVSPDSLIKEKPLLDSITFVQPKEIIAQILLAEKSHKDQIGKGRRNVISTWPLCITSYHLDSLNKEWNQALKKQSARGETQLSYHDYTCYSSDLLFYSNADAALFSSSDSLDSWYVGNIIKNEFVAYFHPVRRFLTIGDFILFFVAMLCWVAVLFFYDESVQLVSRLMEMMGFYRKDTTIYRLGKGVTYNSANGKLINKTGSISLLAQSVTIMNAFLHKKDNTLTYEEICNQFGWENSKASHAKIHTAINRLKEALSQMSSAEIVFKQRAYTLVIYRV